LVQVLEDTLRLKYRTCGYGVFFSQQ